MTGDGEERYCKEEIVETYGFQKVSAIVTGGRERYHSVWNGLNAISRARQRRSVKRRSGRGRVARISLSMTAQDLS